MTASSFLAAMSRETLGADANSSVVRSGGGV